MQVVPESSSYPGFGAFVLLKGVDHINVCKPSQRSDPAYTELKNFLWARIEESQNKAELSSDK